MRWRQCPLLQTPPGLRTPAQAQDFKNQKALAQRASESHLSSAQTQQAAAPARANSSTHAQSAVGALLLPVARALIKCDPNAACAMAREGLSPLLAKSGQPWWHRQEYGHHYHRRWQQVTDGLWRRFVVVTVVANKLPPWCDAALRRACTQQHSPAPGSAVLLPLFARCNRTKILCLTHVTAALLGI